MTTKPAPRLWPGCTMVILAGGPSLDLPTIHAVYRARLRRDDLRVLAINDSAIPAFWADALYGCDGRWWDWWDGLPGFQGRKFALDNSAAQLARWPAIHLLRNTGREELETDPTGLRTGRDGGYQSINLAVHLGARRILLLGYDMQFGHGGRQHWHGTHRDPVGQEYKLGPKIFETSFLPPYRTIIEPLKQLKVQVINCTSGSKLDCFPKARLEDVL